MIILCEFHEGQLFKTKCFVVRKEKKTVIVRREARESICASIWFTLDRIAVVIWFEQSNKISSVAWSLFHKILLRKRKQNHQRKERTKKKKEKRKKPNHFKRVWFTKVEGGGGEVGGGVCT